MPTTLCNHSFLLFNPNAGKRHTQIEKCIQNHEDVYRSTWIRDHKNHVTAIKQGRIWSEWYHDVSLLLMLIINIIAIIRFFVLRELRQWKKITIDRTLQTLLDEKVSQLGINSSAVDIPDEYMDIITHELITNPIVFDKRAYEATALYNLVFVRHFNRLPHTNVQLTQNQRDKLMKTGYRLAEVIDYTLKKDSQLVASSRVRNEAVISIYHSNKHVTIFKSFIEYNLPNFHV